MDDPLAGARGIVTGIVLGLVAWAGLVGAARLGLGGGDGRLMPVKSVGIVRAVDELGRVVIPIEIRRLLGIQGGDPLEVFVDGDHIVLRPYRPGCWGCGQAGVDLVEVAGRVRLCRACLEDVARRAAGG